MSHWEANGKSNEWYTPKYIFDALECSFDLDVASPSTWTDVTHVPSMSFISENSLETKWSGFVWMNPPFGGRNGLVPWLDKFFQHGNGIALVPDRTSAPWWQSAAKRSDGILFIDGKVKFLKPDGSSGDSPSTGTCLMAKGTQGTQALFNASRNRLGLLMGVSEAC